MILSFYMHLGSPFTDSTLPQSINRTVIDVAQYVLDWIFYTNLYYKDAQLSQRDRAAGCVIVFAKSRRLELGDNILRTL